MGKPRVSWLHRTFRFLLTDDERVVFEGSQGSPSNIELRALIGDQEAVERYIAAYERLGATYQGEEEA